MYQLTQIFKKYLREYASKILEQKIPKASAQATSLGMYMHLIDIPTFMWNFIYVS